MNHPPFKVSAPKYYQKGEVIETIIPWKVIPLFATEKAVEEEERLCRLIPRYIRSVEKDSGNNNHSTNDNRNAVTQRTFQRCKNLNVEDDEEAKNINMLVVQQLPPEQGMYLQRLLTHTSDDLLIHNVWLEDCYLIYSIVLSFHYYVEITSNNKDSTKLDFLIHILSGNNNDNNNQNDVDDDEERNNNIDWSLDCQKLLYRSWQKLFGEGKKENHGINDDGISFVNWKVLINRIYRQMHIISIEHPLIHYATNIVPLLNQNELQTVIQVLSLLSSPGINYDSNEKTMSSLAIMKHIQDIYRDKERLYGFLLEDPLISGYERKYPFLHSCLPTAQLSCTPKTNTRWELNITALYDNTIAFTTQEKQKMDVSSYLCGGLSLFLIPDDHSDGSVDIREASVVRRTGQCCGCIRCRWETLVDGGVQSIIPNQKLLADTLVRKSDNNNSNSIISLGHYYLRIGNFNMAEWLYRYLLEQNSNNNLLDVSVADIWHALGAIELSQNHFLKAQRIWKKALDQNPEIFEQHPGMQLQLEKIKAYRYLSLQEESLFCINQDQKSCTANKTNGACTSYDSDDKFCNIKKIQYFPVVPTNQNACIAHQVVDMDICQKLIDIAETTGTWTQQRHYAVPTYDIPIHTVPSLLNWFYNDFWIPIMRPLMAKQFQTTKNYYIHDAFLVRYEAGKNSNHLPIHTDESTHSFVVALNDDYENGGTYFLDFNHTVHLKTGQVLSFRGDNLQHGGEAVTHGVRYIIAVFLYHDDDDNANKSSSTNDNIIDNNNKGIKRKDCNNTSNGNMDIIQQGQKRISQTNNNTVDQSLFRESKRQTSTFSFGFRVE